MSSRDNFPCLLYPPKDATIHNAGFFIGLRAAMSPDAKMDVLRPIVVVHSGVQQKITLAPKQQSSLIRFVAAKNISLGIDQCMRVW